MTQFYVETEGLWFGPEIEMIWDSAFLIWHFCYQHRFVVSDLLFMTIKCFCRHCWESPLPTIWVSKPPTTSWEPSYRNTSWSVGVLWPWWWPCCPSSRPCPSTPLTTPPSPVGGRRRSCQELSRPLPGLYIWCTHTWYTTDSVHPYEDQDLCWCPGLSVYLSILCRYT